MFRFTASVLLLAAVSITVPSCFDKVTNVQESNRNSMGIKNPVSVSLVVPSSYTGIMSIYADGQIVTISPHTSDTIIVPDSSYLYARWGSSHADTIAHAGLIWNIQ